MSKRYRYDYYRISVPGDLADEMHLLASQAISEAKQQTRLYCMPAVWSAKPVSGEVGDWTVTFKVCRKRYA